VFVGAYVGVHFDIDVCVGVHIDIGVRVPV